MRGLTLLCRPARIVCLLVVPMEVSYDFGAA